MKKILLDVCEGLKRCHQNDLVHLDIKPENILLSENGNYKLSDLGLMKSLNDPKDISTIKEGDSRYMAKELLDDISPEKIRSSQIDLTKADIYSLGISIYQMIVGINNSLPANGPEWH